MLFSQAGTVAAVEVITVQETTNPKCFAFVEMNNRAEAEKAIGLLNGTNLNRRIMKVNIARPREERPAGGGWYTDSPPPNHRTPKNPSRRKPA